MPKEAILLETKVEFIKYCIIAFTIYFIKGKKPITKLNYRTRAIITRGLYTFYPLFEVHLCTVTFGLMNG